MVSVRRVRSFTVCLLLGMAWCGLWVGVQAQAPNACDVAWAQFSARADALLEALHAVDEEGLNSLWFRPEPEPQPIGNVGVKG